MERKVRKCRKILAALLAGCVLAWGIPASADSLSELEGQQDALRQQQEELEEKSQQLNEELERLKNDEAQQQEYYNSLEEQSQVVMDQIDNANERLDQLDGEISTLQEDLAGSQAELDADFETLKERIRALYKLGQAGTLEIILNSESLPDLAQKTEILSAVTRHDTQLMDKIREQMDAMAERKDQLESDRKEADELKKTLEQKQAELTQLQEESQRVLEELGQSQEDVNQQIADADQQKEELIQQLSELQKQWLAEKEAQEAAESEPEPEPDSSSSNSGTSSGSGDSSESSSGGGSSSGPSYSSGYVWPVPGFTKVGDGWYEGGRDHKGIDIIGAGIYGQPIVAAQSGQVITAYTADEWGYGWGYHVMIGHDDGYATQYAHMSRVVVSTGDYVEQGQIIGYVGNTGDSYGAHLHFELWENGERINPEIVLPYR